MVEEDEVVVIAMAMVTRAVTADKCTFPRSHSGSLWIILAQQVPGT